MSSKLRVNYGHIALPSRPSANNVHDAESTNDAHSTAYAESLLGGESVFSSAVGAPDDPILGMRDAFLADPATRKLNLAVGVYRTAEGQPLVLDSVKAAEAHLLAETQAGRMYKEYLPPVGMLRFAEASVKLLYGDSIAPALAEDRVVTAQCLSGVGGLHLAARMIAELMPTATVHLPQPTWPIHPDIFTVCGVKVAHYPYYDPATGGMDAPRMLAYLRQLPAGAIVLLHACAHNPTGVDPTPAQWTEIARAVEERGLVPLVDSAYQGLASGDLDEDAVGTRMLAAIPNIEMLSVQSYAKCMGLYGERAGVFAMITNDADVAKKISQQLTRVIRLTYSSPPQHGAAIAATVLTDAALTATWRKEVTSMAGRLQEMRDALYAALLKVDCPPPTGRTSERGWRHVLDQRGMFTYTGLTPAQVDALRNEHHIYMPTDGRISMAGLTLDTCAFLAESIKAVLPPDASPSVAMEVTPAAHTDLSSPTVSACHYDHLQFFVDSLQPLAHYKAIEARLNSFAKRMPCAGGARSDVAAARAAWCEMGAAADPSAFHPHGRDLVEQMLHGFGWRITGVHEGEATRSLLLSTCDSSGARFVVTCANEAGEEAAAPAKKKAKTSEGGMVPYDHFAPAHLERYTKAHAGAQGVAVLGFSIKKGELERVVQRYNTRHPKLVLAPPHTYADGTTIFDVFAYYLGEMRVTEADPGTVLRFVERPDAAAASAMPLPGLVPVAAEYDPHVLPAYCDHWVSNVHSRVGFLQTLEETLGFVPKVDFNAGVVAAGEAQIESTVMGNVSDLKTTEAAVALKDQSQVFLPTNNALSPVGHVHWYLEELGQGIQHVASRVASLPEYVQRANDMRAITGEGFTFLNIPRTYYGLLETALLVNGGVDGELLGECATGLAEPDATAIIGALVSAGLVDKAGALSLDADEAQITAALASTPAYSGAHCSVQAMVHRVLRRSCYVNLWKLMRDQLPEPTYLSIVRNKILIDVQGEDVLMQIFTCVVLQRKAGTEAPFLEFIQRVCAQSADGSTGAPIRPGCGGFGIRNFLTLFLSIEVSKAMLDSTTAAEAGKPLEAAFHDKRVKLFTEQLVEANPILTEISDCMTGEGKALDANDGAAAAGWAFRKEAANKALQDCSHKYNGLMKQLREAGW